MTVQYPEIRKQIAFLVEAVWSADDPTKSKPQDVSLAAHYFLEDWELDGPIGVVVGNYLEVSEVASISHLASLLFDLVQKYGWELTSTDYVTKPEWSNIKQAAEAAKNMIGEK